MVLIGHAAQDENGSIEGPTHGDQTGKEICTREWYDRKNGWGVYLECLNPEMANRAAEYMEQICADDHFGYSQTHRWYGYKSIESNDGVAGAEGDFDCSSLVISCYIFAGLDIQPTGYTGNLERIFMNTGRFRSYSDAAHLKSGNLSTRGGIYLAPDAHVAMVLSNSDMITDEPLASPAPSIAPPYVETFGKVRVRTGPGTQYDKIYTTHSEKLPYLGTDADTGWHAVETEYGTGWVTGKKKYAKVVLA